MPPKKRLIIVKGLLKKPEVKPKKGKLIVKPRGTLLPKPKKKIEKPAEPPEKKKPKMAVKKRLIITKRLPAKPKDDTGKQLKSFTGLNTSQANQADPIALFGMLPQELRKNVLLPSQRGGGVKVGKKSPLGLVKEYDELNFEQRLRFKGSRMKSLDTILQDVGRLYGRLPKAKKVNYASGRDPQFGRGMIKFRTGSTALYEDVELFKLYSRKFGPEFDAHVARVLEQRLSPKNYKPEKQYQKLLKKHRENVRKQNINRGT